MQIGSLVDVIAQRFVKWPGGDLLCLGAAADLEPIENVLKKLLFVLFPVLFDGQGDKHILKSCVLLQGGINLQSTEPLYWRQFCRLNGNAGGKAQEKVFILNTFDSIRQDHGAICQILVFLLHVFEALLLHLQALFVFSKPAAAAKNRASEAEGDDEPTSSARGQQGCSRQERRVTGL